MSNPEHIDGSPITSETPANPNPDKHLKTAAETSRISERPDAK